MTLQLEQLSKTFPGGVLAVDDVSLLVPDGALVVLVGPSGCGKSTVLRLVAGLETPTAGRILADDRDMTDLSPRWRNLAMVFQQHALYPHMTVRQNLRFGLRMRRTPRTVMAERVRWGA